MSQAGVDIRAADTELPADPVDLEVHPVGGGGPQPHIQRNAVHLHDQAVAPVRIVHPDPVVRRCVQLARDVSPTGREAPGARGRAGEGRGDAVQPVGAGVDRRAEDRRVVAVEKAGVDVVAEPGRGPQQLDEQVAVGDDPVQPGPSECVGELGAGLRPGRRVRDHLGEQRVVVHADDRTGRHPAVDADIARHLEARQRAALGQEGGVLGVEPGLHGVSGQAGGGDLRRQRQTLRDQQLKPDQVEPGDELGDRVFHLQAGVHLQEEEGAGPVEHELDRADAGVVDGPGGGDGRLGQPGPQLRADGGRWRLLDDLLVASLHRAVALEQRDDRAVVVADDLHLDVPGPLEVALEEDRAVAERRQRLAAGTRDGLVELVGAAHDPHAAAPAAGSRLDQQRETDVCGAARQTRHAGRSHQRLGAELVAHRLDRLGGRPDPGQPGRPDRAGEPGVLGQEAVAGMDRVGPGAHGRGDHQVAAQVGLGRGVAR